MFYSEITALFSVIVIDLVLAGDNAVVVGMAAAGLRPAIRHKAIIYGIAAAAVLRIVFAIFTSELLEVLGLTLAGGLLLLWVTWKLWREIRAGYQADPAYAALSVGADARPSAGAQKTFGQALLQIVVADVSMSLDNVLAVAGAARHHIVVLVIGLTLSVALMGVAANLVAGILKKHPWLSYLGLVLIALVAMHMIWDGGHQVANAASRAGFFGGPHPFIGDN
jgi:YjbE family integral membrane protein